jgi:hypothetical protein
VLKKLVQAGWDYRQQQAAEWESDSNQTARTLFVVEKDAVVVAGWLIWGILVYIGSWAREALS